MIYYEKHLSYSLSQGRHSKPQPATDLETGVWEPLGLELLICLITSLSHSHPSIIFPRASLPFSNSWDYDAPALGAFRLEQFPGRVGLYL